MENLLVAVSILVTGTIAAFAMPNHGDLAESVISLDKLYNGLGQQNTLVASIDPESGRLGLTTLLVNTLN
jgi:hypothetical protein